MMEKTSTQVMLRFQEQQLEVEINEQEVLLGRRSPQVLDLTDFDALALGVSRVHAAMSADDGHIYLEDRGSIEGTLLNERRIMPFMRHPIAAGDEVSLAGLRFVIHTAP